LTPHQHAIHLFETRFEAAPELVIRAPGRINLIGEHTDYNDGFVLPIAIEKTMWLALRTRTDRIVRVVSSNHGEASLDLDSLHRNGTDWVEYVKGVAWALGSDDLSGWDGVIFSEISEGAGLSSSAALEIATAIAFATASGRRWNPVEGAMAGQRAENEWVGLSSGIMDQLIVATATADHATLIDCRSLSSTQIPLPSDAIVVILDTGTRRRLVDSEYEERRDSCRRAAQASGVAALRDLSVADLPKVSDLVDDVTYRRVRHVITENARTTEAASALQAGDTARVGSLMGESHDSLRDDYEVSSPALDLMVDIAKDQEGCIGARMTGAGFGGCAVALVDKTSVTDFAYRVTREFSERTGTPPNVTPTTAAQGASYTPAAVDEL
jgi:galactokinase